MSEATDRDPGRRGARRSLLRGGTLLALLLGASACGSAPPVKEFVIAAAFERAPPAASGAQVLRVREVKVRPLLDRDGIAYRQGDVRAGNYHYSRWAEPLQGMVQRALLVALRGSGRFARVLDPFDAGEADLVLAVELTGFHEATDAAGQDVRAVVSLDATWFPGDWVEIGFREPVPGASMEDLVAALDAGLRRALADLVGSLGEPPEPPSSPGTARDSP